MDSNTLTIIGTFIVAIISGLLAYSSSLSTKEKEVKLTVYEKLGLDSHSIIESLYSNTEYHLLVFMHCKNLTRKHLIDAGNQQKLDIDKIRELRIRMRFFDKKCYEKFEKITQSHGVLIPKIYGYVRRPGEKIEYPSTLYTSDEVADFTERLSILNEEIDQAKEYITNMASKKYNKTLSSSKKITALAFAVLILAFITFIFIPFNETTSEAHKEKATLLHL